MGMQVRTRFAPSPTGYLHIGGVRTALFSWLHARHCGGTFILRIEDTDRERSTEAAVNVILEGLRWLDLDWDEGPYFQSQRMDRYRQVIDELLVRGSAYHCYCSREELEAMREAARARGAKPKYDGRCRNRREPVAGVSPVVRFRNPLDGEVVVDDLIQGRVVYRNVELDDLIIARSGGAPTYNLTVVVDDLDMAVTHVIRGDDHLNNAARQINIFRALDRDPPQYAHVPLILGPDGQKLSKRHGTVSVLEYREEGFLPEALLNYLVRLGWSHGNQEIFSRAEMVALFDVRDVNRAAAAINPDKLVWLNQHYMKTVAIERLTELVAARLAGAGVDLSRGPDVSSLVSVQRNRTRTLKELVEQSRLFYEDSASLDAELARSHLAPELRAPFTRLAEQLRALPEWDPPSLRLALEQVATAAGLKIGKLAQPLRVALTGGTVSPSIDSTMWLLGRARVLRCLDHALALMATATGPEP
jgi:glutamyl-tRNA synthetase